MILGFPPLRILTRSVVLLVNICWGVFLRSRGVSSCVGRCTALMCILHFHVPLCRSDGRWCQSWVASGADIAIERWQRSRSGRDNGGGHGEAERLSLGWTGGKCAPVCVGVGARAVKTVIFTAVGFFLLRGGQGNGNECMGRMTGHSGFFWAEPWNPAKEKDRWTDRQRATRSSIDRPGTAGRRSSKQPQGRDRSRAGRGKM